MASQLDGQEFEQVLGDGDGPNRLEPRVDLGRETTVDSGPSWKPRTSVRKPGQLQSAWGEGKEASAL